MLHERHFAWWVLQGAIKNSSTPYFCRPGKRLMPCERQSAERQMQAEDGETGVGFELSFANN